jgi:hypothetical protein
MMRERRSGAEIKAAILTEAARRGLAANSAVAIANSILREKAGGSRHAR